MANQTGFYDSKTASKTENFICLENGKLTLRRTDTQEEIVIRDIFFSYDSTTGKYVFQSGSLVFSNDSSERGLFTSTYKD